jgi:hypothetical protein
LTAAQNLPSSCSADTDGSHFTNQLSVIDQNGQLSHFDISSAGEDGGFIAFSGGLFFNAFDPIYGDVLYRIDANGVPAPVRDVCGCPTDHCPRKRATYTSSTTACISTN